MLSADARNQNDGNHPLRPALLLTAGLLSSWRPSSQRSISGRRKRTSATGPPGSTAYRFITAFASVTEANHPRIHIKLVQVADLAASAKAIEDHATDLGIVRSDAVIPINGETIAILRRDVVAFVVPAKAFRGRPPTPDDAVTTLAITYRFVAPNTMLDVVAGAIARSIFKTKAQLVAKTPLASQIEAPDPDDKTQSCRFIRVSWPIS